MIAAGTRRQQQRRLVAAAGDPPERRTGLGRADRPAGRLLLTEARAEELLVPFGAHVDEHVEVGARFGRGFGGRAGGANAEGLHQARMVRHHQAPRPALKPLAQHVGDPLAADVVSKAAPAGRRDHQLESAERVGGDQAIGQQVKGHAQPAERLDRAVKLLLHRRPAGQSPLVQEHCDRGLALGVADRVEGELHERGVHEVLLAVRLAELAARLQVRALPPFVPGKMQEGLAASGQGPDPETVEVERIGQKRRARHADVPVEVVVLEMVEEDGVVLAGHGGLDVAVDVLVVGRAEDAGVGMGPAQHPGELAVAEVHEGRVAHVERGPHAGQLELVLHQAVELLPLALPDLELVGDRRGPLVPAPAEAHLDLIEIAVAGIPGLVQRGDVAVALLEKCAETGLIERGLGGPVAGIDQLQGLAVDLGPHGRAREIAKPLVHVPLFRDVLREFAHLEVLAVLVVGHPDVVAFVAERLGRPHHGRLAHLAPFALPVGRPVVHEVVGQSPFGGLPERAAVVAQGARVVVAVQGRVVHPTHPPAQLLVVIPGVPVEKDVADPRAVQGRCRGRNA